MKMKLRLWEGNSDNGLMGKKRWLDMVGRGYEAVSQGL